jgi:hypothetical protein
MALDVCGAILPRSLSVYSSYRSYSSYPSYRSYPPYRSYSSYRSYSVSHSLCNPSLTIFSSSCGYAIPAASAAEANSSEAEISGLGFASRK